MSIKGNRNYKNPLKFCDNCKYRNKIKDGEDTVFYCKLFTKFISNCKRKVEKTK